MFAPRLFQRLFNAATMVLLLLIVMVGVGDTSAFGQAPAARSGDAGEAAAAGVTGPQAL